MHVAKWEIRADGRRVGIADKPQQRTDAAKKYRNKGYNVQVRRLK
jgi:phenylpropionate dioxygenase-like ring-hydroxylating dioxygenase large terminal subunit